MSVNTDYIAVEKPDQKKSFDISTLTLSEETIIDITDLGGIAGLNTSVIKYCDNYGDVGYPHTGYNVGGIAGRQSGRVLGCTNAGEVTARKDVGGIVGQVEPYTSWNVTGTGLGEVQSQLYRLESLLRTTLGDFGDSQAEARALMQQILELLRKLQRYHRRNVSRHSVADTRRRRRQRYRRCRRGERQRRRRQRR